MNTAEYQKIQNLRKNLHETKKTSTTNESQNIELKKLQEQLSNSGCGSKQINS